MNIFYCQTSGVVFRLIIKTQNMISVRNKNRYQKSHRWDNIKQETLCWHSKKYNNHCLFCIEKQTKALILFMVAKCLAFIKFENKVHLFYESSHVQVDQTQWDVIFKYQCRAEYVNIILTPKEFVAFQSWFDFSDTFHMICLNLSFHKIFSTYNQFI